MGVCDFFLYFRRLLLHTADDLGESRTPDFMRITSLGSSAPAKIRRNQAKKQSRVPNPSSGVRKIGKRVVIDWNGTGKGTEKL